MKLITRLIYVVVLIVLLQACKPNRLKVDISELKTELNVVRFEKELFSASLSDLENSLSEMRRKDSSFFDLFTYKIIRVGGFGDEQFTEYMRLFLTDSMILEVKQKVDSVFQDFSGTEKQLQKAFKYYRYHFPEKKTPTIYTYISGFNQSIVTAENIVGVSLDKYLGRDCSYYRQLNSTPQYKVLNMHPGKIVSDVAYAWGLTEFEYTNKATTLIDNMIHHGKIMYFVDALLPEEHDSIKIGYTASQLKWCSNNEAQMWAQLIEHKMLFSNNRMDIVRYINQSPTTSGFPLESPGRTGVWIGWQIVRKYMNKHPEISLDKLMKNNDYQQILNDSEYLPD